MKIRFVLLAAMSLIFFSKETWAFFQFDASGNPIEANLLYSTDLGKIYDCNSPGFNRKVRDFTWDVYFSIASEKNPTTKKVFDNVNPNRCTLLVISSFIKSHTYKFYSESAPDACIYRDNKCDDSEIMPYILIDTYSSIGKKGHYEIEFMDFDSKNFESRDTRDVFCFVPKTKSMYQVPCHEAP